MLKIVKIQDSFGGHEYRIEGLKDVDVLRIYKAVEARRADCLELEVLTQCFKMDIKKLGAEHGQG